jgi:sulfur-oxidizing protein SoxX
MMKRMLLILTAAFASAPMVAVAEDAPPEVFQPWTARGRKVAISGSKGNCLACHRMPIPEEEFHGELGPSLVTIGSKYDEGKIRLRVVDIQELLPDSLMPPMYMNPADLTDVAKKFQGRTVLTAQEVEDLVAYLLTLK